MQVHTTRPYDIHVPDSVWTHFRPFGALPTLLSFRHWFIFKEAVPQAVP